VIGSETQTAVRETLGTMDEAERYNTWLYDRARPYLGERVLDAGAGTGEFTERLLADGRTVVALEPEPELAAGLRERFRGEPRLTVAEAEAGNVDGGPFDTVLCFNVLEHIADDAGTLHSLRRAVGAHGRLLLLVPAHPLLYGEIDRALGHERRYRRDDLRRLLEETGYRPEVVRAVNPVGALGWLVSSRLLGRDRIPTRPLRAYDVLVPLLRAVDPIPSPFGLSLWAVAGAA
jgi:SAM-dependent methyltransferase